MKLVRDFIPHIITQSGKTCEWHRIKNRDEHMLHLKDKILEETEEFIEDPCLEEAADMIEVIKTFIQLSGLSFRDVLEKAEEKACSRGGFLGGVILDSVNESR